MTTEQVTKTEELKDEDFQKESSEEVSQDTESVSEDEEKPEGEAEVITFNNKEEFESSILERVTAESNRIANKSTAPIQSENDKLKKEKSSLERQLSDKAEDSNIARLTKAEKEDWGETPEVRTIQEVRSEVIKQDRINREKEIELTDQASELGAIGLRQDAFEKALKLFLPEDKEFLSTIDAFVEKLLKASTKGEMDLLYQLEEGQIKAKAEAAPKPKRPKPDNSLASAPGGSRKDDSPEARVTRGLALKAKQQ